MVKTRVYIKRRNRTVDILEINTDKGFFVHGDNLYSVFPNAANLTWKPKVGVNPTPELVYFEDSPVPVNVPAEKSGELLDDFIIENALKQSAEITGPFTRLVISYLTNPGKMLALGLTIFILVMIFYALLGAIPL